MIVVGNGVGRESGANFPVHPGLAAPGGQGPLQGSHGGGSGRKIGTEAEGDAARGILSRVIGALEQGAIGAFHIGQRVVDGYRARAVAARLVAGGDANRARAGRVAVARGLAAIGRRRHPHLDAGIGPDEVVAVAGFHAGCAAVVGIAELHEARAPAVAKAVAVDGEHGLGASRQLLRG